MPAKALVVEDDRATASLLRSMLEAEHCEVDVAFDGEAALARIAGCRYDVVLLDISLPKKVSGTDILQHFAMRDAPMLARVIVVTGVDLSEIRKLYPAICHAFGKPVIPSRVMRYVRQCIESAQTPEPLGGL